MNRQPDLLVTGTLTWETSALVDRLPDDGRVDWAGDDALYRGAKRIIEGGGGSAANVAVAAARAGLLVTFVGRAGDDDAGHRCLAALHSEGIRTDIELVPGRRTKRSLLLIESNSARVQFRVAVPPLLPPPLPAADMDVEMVRDARWLHLDRVSEAAPEILAIRGGHSTSLDLHDLPTRPSARRRLVSMLPWIGILQIREAAVMELRALLDGTSESVAYSTPGLTEALPIDDATIIHELEALSGRVPKIVVTRGERGAAAVETGGVPFLVGPVAQKLVLDPTGAGDAFAAALIVGMLAGRGFPDACCKAAEAGSRCCGWFGARYDRFLEVDSR